MKKYFLTVLIVWTVQLSAYWLSTSLASIDGHFPSPQPDTKLYCQSARRIAEGRPFSYSEGESASTGTTSVLHPFVLSVPYACGATGDGLLVAGFFLNGLLYLVFLLGWTLTICRCVREDRTRCLAVAMLGLASQPAVCAFGQTDTGLWMAVSAMFVAALSCRRLRMAAALLILGPWVRPEGVILIVAVALSMLVWAQGTRRHWLAVGVSALSAASVFAFNWYLTGRFQFDSVAHKGYFKMLPFADAVGSTLKDGMSALRTFFVGTTADWPESIYFLPVFGGLFLVLGFVSRNWRKTASIPLVVMGFATLGAFSVVISSGWMGTNFDRYLAWTMPVFLILTAEGAIRAGKLPFMQHMRCFPFVLCLTFYMVTAIGGVVMLHATSRVNAASDEFQRACELAMAECDQEEKRSSPGSVGGLSCSDAYDFSARRYRHLAGLYSPDFFNYNRLPNAFELLKRRRDLRFDFWDIRGHESVCAPGQKDAVFGPSLIVGPYGRELRRADWRTFDMGETIVDPVGKSLVARLDVGYLPDEKAMDYEVVDRWGREPPQLFFMAAPLNDGLAVDGGICVQGGDMFTVPLLPGRDCDVTLRTLSRHGSDVMKTPVKMLLQVDGVDVGFVQYDLNVQTNAFQDVSFRIPGTAIGGSPCRVGLLGDHIVCGYWFWQ